jgi:hypothetical protein
MIAFFDDDVNSTHENHLIFILTPFVIQTLQILLLLYSCTMENLLDLIPLTDLVLLGIQSSEIRQSEILRQRETHIVCRLELDRGWFILKWFKHDAPLELFVYELLERYKVPTLPVHARTSRSLLLEDLGHSKHWRLATSDDMSNTATGLALAEWYLSLHRAGKQILQLKGAMPSILSPWIEKLTVDNLTAAGKILGLENKAVWAECIQSLEPLKIKACGCPITFNYDDFAQENLAISRNTQKPFSVIVFDYDCFTLGPAYTDWRNVAYSLEGDAREAFAEAYGPVSATERLLDLPLATFFGLLVASQRTTIPGWARSLLESVNNGELIDSIHTALQT